MNCEQCHEEVLELIERASTDASGVNEILSRCPDCRAEFDELSATLNLVSELPTEPVPESLDQRILHAASKRHIGADADASSSVVVMQPRNRQVLPWAVAAVAALGLGLGIAQSTLWGGSQQEPVAQAVQQDAERPAAPPAVEGAVETETPPPTAPEEIAGQQLAVADATKKQTRRRRSRERAVAQESELAEGESDAGANRTRGAEAPKEPEHLADRSETDSDRGGGFATEEALPARQSAGSATGKAFGVGSDASASTGSSQSARICKARTRALEKKLAGDPDYLPIPQEQLDVGLCYVKLDQPAKARRWLERAAAHAETAARARTALEAIK